MLEGSTLGTLVELMVRAEILAGSDGRLIPSRFEPDVDHRDLIVADVGGYGALWLQVKVTGSGSLMTPWRGRLGTSGATEYSAPGMAG